MADNRDPRAVEFVNEVKRIYEHAEIMRAIDQYAYLLEAAGTGSVRHEAYREEAVSIRRGISENISALLRDQFPASERVCVRSYWRSLLPDGSVWTESKSLEEVIEQAEHATEPLTFQRMDVYEVSNGWEPAE